MPIVKVCRFEYFDTKSMSFRRSKEYATLPTIEAFGALPLMETAREVDVKLVHKSGLVEACVVEAMASDKPA